MTPILATLFDSAYLVKGLALIRSLQQRHTDFRLFVLALDDAAERAVNRINDERVMVIPFAEHATAELRAALVGRTIAEQCYTITPDFTRSVMQSFKLPHVTYVDADSALFASLDPFYNEIGNASIAVIPHRFPPRMAWREKENGRFNVNCMFFRNDETGRRALDEWSAQCLNWCYNRTERAADGTLLFADQGFITDWDKRYGAHVLKHNGINLAAWNVSTFGYSFDHRLYVIEYENTEGDPVIWKSSPDAEILEKPVSRITRIDPLILWHAHEVSMKVDSKGRVAFTRGNHPLREPVIKHVYEPYEKVLGEIHNEIEQNR